MALKPQLSFSSGELDPILHDRVTLERFQNALGTARNVMVGKQGTILSRFGRFNFKSAKHADTPIKIYCPPNSGLLLEVGLNPTTGRGYFELYDLSGTSLKSYDFSVSSLINATDGLDALHFEYSKDYIYMFPGPVESGLSIKFFYRIQTVTPFAVTRSDAFTVIPDFDATYPTVTGVSGSSGYGVDYAFTGVIDGQETVPHYYLNSTSTMKKPILATDDNELVIHLGLAIGTYPLDSFNEIRIYQRPAEGSSFGFLGRTTNIYNDAGTLKAKFTDVGADADFANGLPVLASRSGLSNLDNVGDMYVGTGAIYQQRLVLGNFIDYNKEAILASRPGFQNNFYADFPTSVDSALNFKAGSSGKAKVLRMVDYNGLIVFTSVGVFASVGVLTPDNLALEKRGNWIIDENVPPLVIPGGLFFVEKSTGAIKQLVYSQEQQAYDSIDQSIFSSHIFKKKTIKSWAFQDGLAPLVIVSFSDGTFATFTYSYEHQMKAWTRGDSIYPVEQVESTGEADLSFFVINKDGDRYIEGTVPRYISPSVYATNPEAHLLTYCALMDGMKIKVDLLNDDLFGTDEFILTPVVADDWEGQLTLTCGTSGLFLLAGNGAVGTIFRFFNPSDKTKLDLEIVSRTDDNTVVVTPTEEFPEEYADDFRLYLTHTIVDGLAHLEGELVSILADGDVLSSPYNDSAEEAETFSVVQGGEIDLDTYFSYRSAITIVGRPVVSDVKTLNISTAEQAPTMIESLTVNKLYVRTFESRGLYIDNQFPEEKIGEVDGTSVLDMQPLDEYYVPSAAPIIGNRAKPPVSKRIEVTLPGSWEGNGQIAFRQVDPIHFEILSIVADIEVLRRSDR